MKLPKYLSGVCLALFLASCGDSPEEASAKTSAGMKAPIDIGTLPDGRHVKSIVVYRPGSQHNHYVYFVETETAEKATVTTNYNEAQGKTTINRVVVEIDGVNYVPAK